MNDRRHSRLDQATLEKIRAREPEALEVFFKTFMDRVYGYVMTLVKNEALADDIVQKSFLRMHGAVDRLDPTRDPSEWVFTVVTNIARDYWRSWEHRNRGRIVDIEEMWNQPTRGAQPDALGRLEKEEARHDVRRAMEHLSPADREVILLRTYEELPAAEVARILETTPEAVRQRHSRAVRRLGKIYRASVDQDQVNT